jgi:type IV pilus secretin PilQ/predicted competence protein
MGSLTRKKKSSILLTSVSVVLAVAIVMAVNLLSPPVLADDDIEQQKIRRLEILGLDGQDPQIVEAAREALTLYSVDVLPNEENINVSLRLSGIPSYDTYIYPGNRLVVDLRNTINLSVTSVIELEEGDPIRKVRNSQYRVTPSFISRIVLDLGENITPEINSDGDNLVISVGMPDSSLVEVPVEPLEQIAEETEMGAEEADLVETAPVESETISVPAVEVATETPEVESIEPIVEVAVEPAPVVEEMIEPRVEVAAPIEEVEIVEVAEAAIEAPAEPAPVVEEMIEPIVEVAAPIEEVEIVEVAEAAIEAPVEPAPVVVEMPVVVNEPPVAPMPAIVPVPEAVEADPPPAEEQELISLTFRDADLVAVLDIIAKKGNLNILAGKGIAGKVTVRLVDVPLDAAMTAILNVNGYGYIKTGSIIRILPLSEIGEVINTVTKTFSLSYASAKSAQSVLEGFLTANGNIKVDDRTNTLIITDVPGNMDRVVKLIPEIDKRVQQVLIEVLIIDSVLGDDADLGVTWDVFNGNILGDIRDRSPLIDDHTFDPVAGTSNATTAAMDHMSVALPVGANALNLAFGTLLGDINVQAFIEAQVTNSDSKVLASPKILTLNNESAQIEIIEEFPYRDVSETSSGGQLTNITFKEIGTKLEVKPQITNDDHVILYIAPEQNSIAGVTSIGVPIVDTRKAETTLIIKNHQTVVLGGLRESRTVTGVTKVPLLGDLPGIKYIFRSVSSKKRDTELIVFITVHIVESPELLPADELKANELANLPRKPNASIELIR